MVGRASPRAVRERHRVSVLLAGTTPEHWIGQINADVCDQVLFLDAVECGAAHGARAMTTPGDTSMVTRSEVDRVMKGRTARVAR